MLFNIEAPSLNGMILNAALVLLFYVSGHGFLFESSIGNLQYAPEVLDQTPGTLCINILGTTRVAVYVTLRIPYLLIVTKILSIFF
jgi:hypothetical protein